MKYFSIHDKNFPILHGNILLNEQKISDFSDIKINNDEFEGIITIQFINIPSISLKGIEKFHNLKSLIISDSEIQNLELFSSLNNLEVLVIQNCKINRIPNIENNKNLVVLNLNNNKITKIENLENCIYLRRLDMDNNLITEIEGLDKLRNLSHLSIYNNPIHNYDGLAYLKSLERLGVDFYKKNTLYLDIISKNTLLLLKSIGIFHLLAQNPDNLSKIEDYILMLKRFPRVLGVMASDEKFLQKILKIFGNSIIKVQELILNDSRFVEILNYNRDAWTIELDHILNTKFD